jgi:hypothetical protein
MKGSAPLKTGRKQNRGAPYLLILPNCGSRPFRLNLMVYKFKSPHVSHLKKSAYSGENLECDMKISIWRAGQLVIFKSQISDISVDKSSIN